MTSSIASNSLLPPLFSNSKLPHEVDLLILELFTRSDLFNVMLTCKDWMTLATDANLWKREAKILQVKSFENISNEVRSLQRRVQISDPILSQKVKTADEFDAEYLHEMTGIAAKQLVKELDEKLALSDQIHTGFKAAVTLGKLGLKNIDALKAYALCLENFFGDKEAWIPIASLYISRNEIEVALAIVDQHLSRSYKKGEIIYETIMHYLNNNMMEKAIALLQTYVSTPDKYFDLKSSSFHECSSRIMNFAKVKEDLKLVETLIDQIVPPGWKDHEAFYLIDTYTKSKNMNEARRVFVKYLDEFEKEQDLNPTRYIEYYVKFGYYNHALRCAQASEFCESTLKYLIRNLEAYAAPQEEIEKVKALLKKS